jgi:uncharacterized protein YkwD
LNQGSPDSALDRFLVLLNRFVTCTPLSMRAAEHHAEDMAAMRKVVDHTLSDGTSAQQNLIDFGYPADTASWGENLAVGTTWNTAKEAFDFWRHSRGHNSNMLKKNFRAIGIARVYDTTSTYTWS